MPTRRTVLGAAGAMVLLAGTVLHAEATQPILIGGGPAGGVYTETVGRICRLVDEHAGEKYGCIPRTAPGAVFNIRAVDIGLMEFGLAQSDRVQEAVAGIGAWEGMPAARVRSVFGLPPDSALLLTSADVANDLVYDVVRIVFENLDALRSTHPALRGLEPAAMLEDLTVPLHPGAARYYREQGWLKV